MKKILSYKISELEPYINWLYFFHAWSMTGKPADAKERLKDDAHKILEDMDRKYLVQAMFGLYDVNSEGDDLVFDDMRIPLLRQQRSAEGQPNVCLSDFVRPVEGGVKDTVGLFATSVDIRMETEYDDDAYRKMLSQTLADRLAEAAAEKMHKEVRMKYWGYAPEEHLTMDELHLEKYDGIRPAVGYPSLPDTSVNFLIDRKLELKDIGIRLTESGAMKPHASVCGLMFAHPQAFYFDLGKIGEDQLRDYARRRGVPVEVLRKFLVSSMMK